jgi:hypothetical protein
MGEPLSSREKSGVEIRMRTESTVAGRWENLAMTLYRTPPSPKEIRTADAMNDEIIATHGAPYALLVFVHAAQKLPDADVRAVSAEIITRRATVNSTVALVLEGKGFWASAMRMAITSIMHFVDRRGHRRFFATEDEAARYLAPFLRRADGSPIAFGEVQAAVHEFRLESD